MLPADANYCSRCGCRALNDETLATAVNTHEPTALERRQMTVLFCDLRHSTRLSIELDAEDLRSVLRLFQDCCASSINRYGGYISRYMGDGLLALFGYPSAHDDDAHRAVLAGIDIVNNVSTMSIDFAGNTINLAVRVGIATGIVVSGDIIGEKSSAEIVVVGNTPNLASRLQTSAGTNKILLSERTFRLVRKLVRCKPAGPFILNGFSGPVSAYQVIAPISPDESQGSSTTLGANRIFVNREEELGGLLLCWSNAKDGEGGVAVIQGEAGIGKSRIVEEFQFQISTDPHFVIEARCSSLLVNSSLHPVFELFRDQSKGGIFGCVQHLLNDGSQDADKVENLFSAIEGAERVNAGLVSQDKRQIEQPYFEIIQLLISISRYRPLLFVIEDCHWADPSTIRLIELLAEQIDTVRLLVIVSARPEFRPTWLHTSNVTLLVLSGLESDYSEKLVKARTVNTPFSNQLCDLVVEKSDGVPLYIEELTQSILEQRNSNDTSETAKRKNSTEKVIVPDTLRDLLMARLDQLGDAKSIAQIGATIGKEFSNELLALVSEVDQGTLDRQIARLVDAQIVFKQDLPAEKRYSFRHSLIQDTAYDSLVSSRRSEYHRRIAKALEAGFSGLGRAKPELLARHFALSGQFPKSVEYWTHACERSLQQSANLEALNHANQGLYYLSKIDDYSESRDELALSLYVHLVAAIAGTRGDADPEVETIYQKAVEISDRLNNKELEYQLINHRRAFYQIRGSISVAIELSKKMLQIADDSGDTQNLTESQRCLGWAYICHGELEKGRSVVQRALSIYRKRDSSEYTRHDTIDPGGVGTINLAWSEWLLGNTPRAKRLADNAVALSREIGHSYTLAYTLSMSAAVFQCVGDAEKVQHLTDEALDVATRRGYRYWIAWGTCFKGWVLSRNQRTSSGIEFLENGLRDYRSTGANLFVPQILCMLADALLALDFNQEAYEQLKLAINSESTSEVYFFSAESRRLAGVAMYKSGDQDKARAYLDDALRIARQQHAKNFEKRVLSSIREYY